MAVSQAGKQAKRIAINRRLSVIREKLEREQEFQDFGATTDIDYRMSNARKKGLKAERRELKYILNNL